MTSNHLSPDTITIDAVGPMPMVRPATAIDVGEVVRRCAADGTAIYPVGGGTMLDYGMPPARPGVAIDLRSLDKVIDFPARDMTITVEAGITIAKLNEITRAEGLHLPIDVPEPERATLGGSIACNVSGPRRYGYGTFRDYVLGITTVNDRGELVSAGGRVVKNVAGYDLMKLHTGALGTLGVITQATLKLRPVPEAWASSLFSIPDERMSDALELISRSATRPSRMSFGRRGFGERVEHIPWGGMVVYEGSTAVVDWQNKRFRDELGTIGVTESSGYQGVSDWEPKTEPMTVDFALRASLRPSAAVDFCVIAQQAPGLQVFGFGGGAIVRCEMTVPGDWNWVPLRKLADELADTAVANGGNIVIERCRSDWKQYLPVWGRPPADLALQKAVKRALDPNNLFNPGRFVTDAF